MPVYAGLTSIPRENGECSLENNKFFKKKLNIDVLLKLSGCKSRAKRLYSIRVCANSVPGTQKFSGKYFQIEPKKPQITLTARAKFGTIRSCSTRFPLTFAANPTALTR